MTNMVLSAALLALISATASGAQADPVAHWDFDEGKGDVLHDRSGNGNHGSIHGATWIRCGSGYALKFDGVDDYVDCGTGASLDLTGPITLQAFFQPTAANRGEPGIVGKFFESYAISYYGSAYFYISSGGNNVSVPTTMGQWMHVAATFDGTTMRMYVNGIEMCSKKSRFEQINHGKNFFIGCIVGDPGAGDINLRKTAFFPGLIDSVRVHNRVLSEREIIECYNLDAKDKGLEPFDTTKLGHFMLEPFYYPEQDKAVVSVNFRWVLPLPKDAQMCCDLLSADSQQVGPETRIDPDSPRHEFEHEFSLDGLKPGTYEFRAALRDSERIIVQDSVKFRYPFAPPAAPPAPAERVVPPLAPEVEPPPYELKLAPGGGFEVTVGGEIYRIESSYSYPHGGENRLVAGPADPNGEPTWQVTTQDVDTRTCRVEAGGKHYKISRLIQRERTRILVKDEISNLADDVIGIILSNRINVQGADDAEATRMSNPTIFVKRSNSGVGLVALDDLYQLQQENPYADGIGQVRTEHFGLDKGASYTIEWAVYPTATTDYYDFISQVRKDEGLNRRIEGAFCFVNRRTPPSKEQVELMNLKYSSIGCLGKPLDDPTVSLEGFEFVEYPQECAALTQTFAQTKALYPDMTVGFHVAHALYACNDPAERFADSRALDENGRQIHYGPNTLDYYGKYFSKERVEEGWRWWIFYPTMTNSFGKAMIEAMERMLNDMGATGMWADGYISGYVRGGYSYDGWDGHSVSIDPETKLITRKQICVPYVALPVLKKVARMISDAGGVLVSNGQPGSRSYWEEDTITSCETAGSDARSISALHLGRSVTPLGNPSAIQNERDCYRDMLRKLDYGALYFWYGNPRITHKTLVEHMYPITFDAIHAGTVGGKERIVTKQSGVYGWHGDRSLHIVYLYDARGALIRSSFTTTVDDSSVRTDVGLERDQAAVVVKVPVTVASAVPVNVIMRNYGAEAIRMALNGDGKAQIRVTNGQFPIKQGCTYHLNIGGEAMEVTVSRRDLTFPVSLDRPVEIEIAVEAFGP